MCPIALQWIDMNKMKLKRKQLILLNWGLIHFLQFVRGCCIYEFAGRGTGFRPVIIHTISPRGE